MSAALRLSVGFLLILAAVIAGCESSATATTPTPTDTAIPPAATATRAAVPAGTAARAATPAPAVGSALTISLAPESNSGESGTALLTASGTQTLVVLVVSGEPPDATQPAHIHDGACGPTLGKVDYPLTPVVNGSSTTMVNVPLDQLKSGQYAINGHKSAAEISVYVFCGNLTQ